MSWSKNSSYMQFAIWRCPGEVDMGEGEQPELCQGEEFKLAREDGGRCYLVCQDCGEEFDLTLAINDNTVT